jgi:hypothetical protein
MRPLLFANWRAINQLFCLVMWMVALALTIVILGHFVDASACASTPGSPHVSTCNIKPQPERPGHK